MRTPILFLKATIPGGAAADLFDAPVMVGGYLAPSGVFVAPHASHRKKRRQGTPSTAPAPAADHFPDTRKMVDQARPPPADKPVTPTMAETAAHEIGVTVEEAEAIVSAGRRAEVDQWWRSDTKRGDVRVAFKRALLRAGIASAQIGGDAEMLTDWLAEEAAKRPKAPVANPAVSDRNMIREAIAARAGDVEMPPPAIMQRVKTMLAIREDIAASIDNGREADRQFQGGGRYEAEVREKMAERIAASDAVLEKFRGLATKNGLDPDAIFAAAGGVADLGGPPAASPKPPAAPEPSAEIEEVAPGSRPAPFKPEQWAMPRGVRPGERVRANKAAEHILRKPDDAITDADLSALAKYTGWGGQGVGASPNEYFTPPEVASAMWSLARTLGFQGGDVLEPSAGTGVFQQTAPSDARMTAIELSDSSARINRLIHGRSGDEVKQGTLEEFATWDQRKFDLVIGNPPFGARDAFRYLDLSPGKHAITRAEQYFMDTALDKAKDGGLVALIVPSGVMDASTARSFRESVLAKGQLLAAFRLPNTAFADSHTEVTTDVIVLRKRPQVIAGALAALDPAQAATLPHWNEDFAAGRYMTHGPGRADIMGTLEPGWRAKAGMGDDITVTGSMADVPEHIAAWQPDAAAMADNSPAMAAILDAAGDRRDAVLRASTREPYAAKREGDTTVRDGVLYVLRDHRWHRAEEAIAEVVDDARQVADLLDTHLSGAADDPALHRIRLTEALDAFVAKHGPPGQNRALLDWTSAPRLAVGGRSLGEHAEMVARDSARVSMLLGAVRPDGTYSDKITGADARPQGEVQTIATALAAKTGAFTVAELAAGSGQDAEAVRDFLHATDGFRQMPEDADRWTTADQYIAGELWPKYDAALAASKDADRAPADRQRMERQAEELLTAIAPMDLGDVGNIEVGSPFISGECLAAWMDRKRPTDAPWRVEDDRGVMSVIGRDRYGGSSRNDLLERVLMRRGVRKDEAADVDQLNAEFRDWLLADPVWRDLAEESYNRSFRGFRPREYSDEPIPTPGLNPDFSVNPYHWKGVRWALEAGKGIIAAGVGVGKTPRGLILNQLLRSTGRATKPAIVMPKSLAANWFLAARKMFPDAKIMVVGETITVQPDGSLNGKEDDEQTRRRKLAEVAQNDHDFVLITLPAWNMLNLEKEREEQWDAEGFSHQRREALGYDLEGKAKSKQVKAEVKAEAKHAGKVAATKFIAGGEKNITLEQTGIDAVILDEGHSMKNLSAPEAGAFRDLKFLGAPSHPSKQAAATFHKMRWIREKSGHGNTFMLTATPTKNSPLEIYSMLQHIAPEVWTERGIRNADDFISRFVETGTETILGTTGEAVEANVVMGFQNMNEVRDIARRFIDRTTSEDVGLKLPKAEVVPHLVDMDAAQTAAYERLRPLLESALKSRDAEGADHPFSIMSDMQKVAADMRLYEPGGDHAASPKMREIAENVHRLAAEGGQIVFADYIGSHHLLRAQLAALGMDPKRIGIINAQETPSSTARQKLGIAFNAGKLDVLIGNTATMGEGLDLQVRTTDIHHADTPWEPASVTQRNGRGLRQGNLMEGVRLHTYLSKGSFDAVRWQSMMSKKDWQTAFWGGGDRLENMQRGSLGRLEMLIMASANPEEARIKFAAQLDAAKDRRALSEQMAAHRTWSSYREAKHQIRGLQARRAMYPKQETPGATESKLELRVARFRRDLERNKSFQHLDQLDAPHVLIDPRTGRVWRPGDEVAVQPGGRFKTMSNEPEDYVVHAVDERAGTVTMLNAGFADASDAEKKRRTRIVPLSDLREGTSPTKVDRAASKARALALEAERDAARDAAIAATKERQVNAERMVAAGRVEGLLAGSSGSASISDLKHMGSAWHVEHGPAVQRALREGFARHAVTGYGAVPVLDGAGRVKMMPGYDVSKLPADHSFVLPTDEMKERLIQEEVEHRVTAPMKAKFKTEGRNRRNPGREVYDGVERHLPEGSGYGYDAGHAPARALAALWGPDLAITKEITGRAVRRSVDNVRAAETWQDALHASAGGMQPPEYAGPGMKAGAMHPDTLEALYDAAHRLGMAGSKFGNDRPAYGSRAGQEKQHSAHAMSRMLRGDYDIGDIGSRLAATMRTSHFNHPARARMEAGGVASPANDKAEMDAITAAANRRALEGVMYS